MTAEQRKTLLKIKEKAAKEMDVAWDKMGATGDPNYCTKKMKWNEENYWFGRFRALEDLSWEIEDMLDTTEKNQET